MLNLALVGLLAGSLLNVSPGGDDDKKDKKDNADTQESVVIIQDNAAQTPLVERYAMGRPANEAPIKLWIEYGFGEAEGIYRPDGSEAECTVGGGAILQDCDIKAQRAAVGLQINPISFDRFTVGVGGVLTAAKNELEGTAGPLSQTGGSLSSDFSVQNLKIYAEAHGKTLGVHAGYMLDLGDEQEFTDATATLPALPTDVVRSDNRNAIQLGADFDYPAKGFRIFGAIDHYWLMENEDLYGATGGDENLFGEEGDGIWNFLIGTGVRVSFAEVGVAAQIVARDRQPVDRNGEGTPGTTPNIGGYVSSLSPYLRIKPPSLPASLYVKGGVADEYNTYGLGIDGANGPRPSFGVTFGLSVGFE